MERILVGKNYSRNIYSKEKNRILEYSWILQLKNRSFHPISRIETEKNAKTIRFVFLI
ncbi:MULTISPECIES: hypothetical protein [Leptospira]|uniref:Uncharacterized protein n=7 Tax=Leptospira borgpetersenii TaxID=174 RepID=M3GMK5_LEPBO|nr:MULTISPECIES: hypothetical protein [Leptospira]EMG02217.1 hypothetical protein LEP1GSC123_0770 [Leptospira borgpetersenii str. 200701203]EMO11853.1 hypothetical protein LEP1GSC137_3725 [Leptospira borgpetersenii str. Noumea 25]EMO64046.1 hypothetical protein LEP1GSC133_1049 [Leptospira borgpetersenii serovar Pomona str. 200901868]ALO26754.1 hypothetical protein LBBP_02522 [Leptospira borgpetersenii serovar Ballum]EKP13679.1 hypothetical protein LEP1GSC128_2541 [Leptospira borgpetersenii str